MSTPRPTRKLTEREESFIQSLYSNKNNMPAAYVTTTEPIPMGSKDDNGPWGGNPDRMIPAGSTLRIVMVSRFGDAGLTDDLKAAYGYHVRLSWEDAAMTDIRPTEAPTP